MDGLGLAGWGSNAPRHMLLSVCLIVGRGVEGEDGGILDAVGNGGDLADVVR